MFARAFAGVTTYTCNACNCRCREERDGRRRVPILVGRREISAGQVAKDGRHGHIALSILLSKVEVERVVLDELVRSIVLSWSAQPGVEFTEGLTVCTPPPERWPATALEMDGFSATHKTLMVLAWTFAGVTALRPLVMACLMFIDGEGNAARPEIELREAGIQEQS